MIDLRDGTPDVVPSVRRSHTRPEDCPTIDLTDARAGDVFFGARPSLLQVLTNMSGELWRHVGLIHEVDGRLYVVEGGLKGLQHRPLVTAASCYSTVGIARVRPEFELQAVEGVQWAADEQQGAYSFPIIVAIYLGWCSFARNRLAISPEWLQRSPFATYATKLDQSHDVATCSHLALQALERGGVALDQFAEAGGLPRSMESLVSPGDIWRLPIFAARYSIEPPKDQPGGAPLTWTGAALESLKRTLSRKKNRSSQVVA